MFRLGKMRYYAGTETTKTKLRGWIHVVQAAIELSRNRSDINPVIVANSISNAIWQQFPVSKNVERLFHLVDLYTIVPMVITTNNQIATRDRRDGDVDRSSAWKLALLYCAPLRHHIRNKTLTQNRLHNVVVQAAGLLIAAPGSARQYRSLDERNRAHYRHLWFWLFGYAICYALYMFGDQHQIPFLMDNTKSNVHLGNWFTIYDFAHLMVFFGYLKTNKIRDSVMGR